MSFKAIPTLRVPYVFAACAFYEEILQFKKEWTWGEPPQHACVSLGDIEIHFSKGEARPSAGFWVYILIDNVEMIYDCCERHDLLIESYLENKPWGMREFSVLDLNGYKLIFGSSTE